MKTLFRFTRLLFFVLPLCTQGQLRDTFQHAFEPLPNTLFQSSFLHDQSALYQVLRDHHPLDSFDGTIPSRILRPTDFEIMYEDLYMSQRLDSNGRRAGGKPAYLMSFDSFNAAYGAQAKKVDCPLHLCWMRYNELDTLALSSGRFDFEGGQWKLPPTTIVLDSARNYTLHNKNVHSSALASVQTKEVFLAGGNVLSHFATGASATIQFVLPDTLIQQNVGGVDAYWVDFDDGKGFVQLVPNQTIAIVYHAFANGVEWAEKFIRIRARQGTSWRECAFRLQLIFAAPRADTAFSSASLPSSKCLNTKPAEPAWVTIDFADSTKGFQKPVVLVEGFEGTDQPFGYLHYESVASGYVFNSNGDRIYTHMSKLAWLMDSLLLRNHDIVYVDFEESKLAVEENAETLLQVLQWIQQQSPEHATTVVGASLGGLITRYALLQAEQQGCCVGVGAYATFDSPHRGAFIPVGIQAQTERMAALFPAVKVLSNPWDYTLASKAAHQMLVSHYDPVAKASFEAFQRTIANRYPLGMYSFGVCNGSIEGLYSEPEDSLDRYIAYGWERTVPVGHHVGALPDTLQFNRQGVRQNMQVVGARSEAHTGQRNYLMESAKLKNIWRVAQMRWASMSGAASAQLIYSAGHATNFIPANVVNAAVERIQLATHQRLQSLYNASLQQGIRVPKAQYSQAFDHIPGSLTDTPESFDYPFVQVFNQTHCFIPSHSALDLRYDSLRIDQRLHEIPFTSFYAPRSDDQDSAKNQMHIETTEEIIDYILNQFHSIYDSFTQPITGIYNNALPMGTAPRYQSNLSGVQIAMGGHLKLACQGPVGKTNSSVIAATKQQLSFYVGPGCQESVLEVLGRLDVGDHPDRTADLYIKKGSTLVLFAKSTTVIGPGSRLIIEEGAKLVVHPKAELHLNGGSLVQYGILEILPGAIFSPLASGTIELQSTTVFEGNGAIAIASQDIKVDGSIRVPSQIAYMHWTDVHCSLNNLGSIELETSGEFKHCRFEQVDTKPYLSLVAMGTELHMDECRFIKGIAGVTIADSTNWSLTHSYFNGCEVGLRALSTPTSFESNTFESCVLGAEIEANGGAIAISRSNFKHCKNVGLIVGNVHLRITCTSFQFNKVGLLVQEGMLDLARHASTTWINNDTAIYLRQVTGLDLAQGHNRFQGNVGYDLYGTVDAAAAISRSNGMLQIAAPYNAFSFNGSTELRQHRDPIYLKYNPTQSISPHLCPKDISPPEDPSSFSNAYEGSLRIAPNPSSSGSGILFLPSPFQGGTVRLISSQGTLVLEREVKSGMRTVMMERPLVKGAYTVQFIHGEQTHALKWMVVN